MKISAKGRYALRLMLDLATREDGEYTSLKDVSTRQAVSMKYLEQIVSQLCRAGYLRSLRGPQGGYRLARRLEDYTVGDILRVTEGDLSPTACLQDEYNACPNASACPTLPFWQGLYDVVNDYVNHTTLADFVNGSAPVPVPEPGKPEKFACR
ncbi:MAG: Rrf2 family transcriptional regulator [Clostridiales bacterium]|nr:Rrf2 family transcriptional regulator [Clostridiales bacterium]